MPTDPSQTPIPPPNPGPALPSSPGHFVPPDTDYTVPGVAAGANPVTTPAGPGAEGDVGPRVSEALRFSDEELGKRDEAQAPAAIEKKEEKPETHCKHCRRNLASLLGIPKPTEEEKERWLRHVLGEPRFEREYVMLSGRVRITLANRSRLETEMVYQQLTQDVRSGEIPAGEVGSPLYFLNLNRLMMVNSLRRLELVTTPGMPPRSFTYREPTVENYPPEGAEDKRTPVKRMDALVSKDITNEALYSMLLAAFRHFEALVSELTERADDPDFYKAVAGQGS